MNTTNPISRFRPAIAALIALAALTEAKADWADLRPGLDTAAVVQLVGMPLLQTRGCKGALQSWNYDAGGYAFFENGRLSHWQPPRALPPHPTANIAAVKSTNSVPTVKALPSASPAKRSTAVSATAPVKTKPAASLLAAR